MAPQQGIETLPQTALEEMSKLREGLAVHRHSEQRMAEVVVRMQRQVAERDRTINILQQALQKDMDAGSRVFDGAVLERQQLWESKSDAMNALQVLNLSQDDEEEASRLSIAPSLIAATPNQFDIDGQLQVQESLLREAAALRQVEELQQEIATYREKDEMQTQRIAELEKQVNLVGRMESNMSDAKASVSEVETKLAELSDLAESQANRIAELEGQDVRCELTQSQIQLTKARQMVVEQATRIVELEALEAKVENSNDSSTEAQPADPAAVSAIATAVAEMLKSEHLLVGPSLGTPPARCMSIETGRSISPYRQHCQPRSFNQSPCCAVAQPAPQALLMNAPRVNHPSPMRRTSVSPAPLQHSGTMQDLRKARLSAPPPSCTIAAATIASHAGHLSSMPTAAASPFNASTAAKVSAPGLLAPGLVAVAAPGLPPHGSAKIRAASPQQLQQPARHTGVGGALTPMALCSPRGLIKGVPLQGSTTTLMPKIFPEELDKRAVEDIQKLSSRTKGEVMQL